MIKKLSTIRIILFLNSCSLLKNNQSENLIYYWIGSACPYFVDTEKLYGFKILCKGCENTFYIKNHNNNVVRKINKKYGENWFERNKNKFTL